MNLFTRDERIRVEAFGGCVTESETHIVNGSLPLGGAEDSGSGSYHVIAGFKACRREIFDNRPAIHS